LSPLLRSSVFAVALGVVGLVAAAPDAHAARTFPESSTSYRKRMDDFVKTLRTVCNQKCPADGRAKVMAALDRLSSRVMDVCADGVVTQAENDWVMSAMPDEAPDE